MLYMVYVPLAIVLLCLVVLAVVLLMPEMGGDEEWKSGCVFWAVVLMCVLALAIALYQIGNRT